MATATAPRPKAKTSKKKPIKKEAVTGAQRRKRIVEQEKAAKKRAIVHQKPKAYIFGGDNAPMTDEDAKTLLGWEEQPEGQTWTEEEIMGTDMNGKKFKCHNNPTNRPFRMTLAKRYCSEMVRGKWELNGEPVILDQYDFIQSGQHRLVGLVLAEQLRQQHPEKWEEDYGIKGPVTIEIVVMYGIQDKTADTMDLGQKRSLGDVFYRQKRFTGDDVTRKKMKSLSDRLAHAVRLVWIRAGGKQVSDAKHYPHSEALEFLERHPRIKEAVEYINLEGKNGQKYISDGYAAGLLYLMATSGTDPDEYRAGEAELDFSMWGKACEFWSNFYKTDLKEGDPIRVCKEILNDIDGSFGFARDEMVGTVVKAFNMWMDKEKNVTEKQLKLTRGRNDDNNIVLTEEPRLGGLDTEIKKEKKVKAEEKEGKKGKPKKVMTVEEDTVGKKKSKKGWSVGDQGWVTSDEDDVWYGEITEISEDKKSAIIKQLETDEEWEVNLVHLQLEFPGDKEDE